MRALAITTENFEHQRQTVMEERRQSYENRPYMLSFLRRDEISRGAGPRDAVEGGRRVHFDVDELAYVLVVVTRDGVPTPLLAAQHPSDKGELATGLGDFIVDPGPGLTLIATSASPFDDVAPLFAAVAGEADPIRSLTERLRVVAPDADVWVESSRP